MKQVVDHDEDVVHAWEARRAGYAEPANTYAHIIAQTCENTISLIDALQQRPYPPIQRGHGERGPGAGRHKGRAGTVPERDVYGTLPQLDLVCERSSSIARHATIGIVILQFWAISVRRHLSRFVNAIAPRPTC